MEVDQVCQVRPGAPVWVWIVRLGKGRWWPGSVLSISALEPFPLIDTRFECCSVGKNGIDGPVFVGITTTRMRYLELRDAELKGGDRPDFVPSAVFAKPEANGAQRSETMTVDAQASVTPAKKSRSKKKPAKTSSPRKDATAAAIG